jgi:branched-chain amino acid transport system ATP-binding protein
MNALNLLDITDLQVRMGEQTILNGVSLHVPVGGIVTVLGSNGVGKTTLMRAVSGVYRSTAGSIGFDGTDITNWPSHRIVAAGLAQAPEGRQIFSSMTVAENLRIGGFGLASEALGEEEEKQLSRFPVLRERYRQKAGTLSGGEQQMLCVARALMCRPKLLLMDEPSLGLAPKIVRQIFDLISLIRTEGHSVLLVEQNAKAALRVADYAYVMDGGRIVIEGTSAELSTDARVRAAYLGGHAA